LVLLNLVALVVEEVTPELDLVRHGFGWTKRKAIPAKEMKGAGKAV
jgi:hypothetical protein